MSHVETGIKSLPAARFIDATSNTTENLFWNCPRIYSNFWSKWGNEDHL